VTPVRRRDLVVVALGLAAATWLVVRAGYGVLPRLQWWVPTPLMVLALAEAFGARTAGTRLRSLRAARAAGRREPQAGRRPHRPDHPDRPVRHVEPMVVARLAVLAQASAYVGAVFVGTWTGVLAYVGPASRQLQAAGPDTVTAVLGIVCAAALAAAALWLESVCRIPPAPGDEEDPLAPHA
jgi:hypothetical protein